MLARSTEVTLKSEVAAARGNAVKVSKDIRAPLVAQFDGWKKVSLGFGGDRGMKCDRTRSCERRWGGTLRRPFCAVTVPPTSD